MSESLGAKSVSEWLEIWRCGDITEENEKCGCKKSGRKAGDLEIWRC